MAFSAGAIEATLTLNRDPFQRGLEEAKAEAQRFQDAKYAARLDADDTGAKTKIEGIRASAERLASSSSTVRVDADTSSAATKLTTIDAQVAGLTRDPKQMKLDADTLSLQAKLAQARQAVDDLNAKKASPKIDADIEVAQRKIMLIQGNLDYLAENAKGRSQVVIDVETAQANARMAEAKAHLEELQNTRPRIDLDISSAEAKVATLEAQLAGLSASTGDAGGAAESAGSQFNAMFAGITAAFPPASTAILSMSGALALMAAPMAAISIGMGGIQAAAAPLAGEFLNLQSVVSATFEQGMKPAITDISALMPTLTSGLVGTASALSSVAQQVGQVVASKQGIADLQATFSNVESIIAGMAPGISGLVQNFLDLASLGTSSLGGLSTVINGLSTQWHELIANLSATGQAQGAMSSLTGALGAVLAVLPPLVQEGVQLMDVLGPPLVGALQLVGGVLNALSGPFGAVTTTILTGLAAWKLLSVGIAGVTTAAGAVAGAWGSATAALGIGAATTTEATVATEASTVALGEEAVAATAAATGVGRVTAAAGFAAAAQGRLAVTAEAASVSTAAGAAGAGRFATALSGIGSAILPVGIALVAGYTAVKAFTTSTDDAVKALSLGGQAAADMKVKIDAQTESADKAGQMTSVLGADIDNWISSNILGIATTQSATDAFNAQRAAMTPLQLAQSDATIAQGDYNKAVKDFGPSSGQAIDAQKKFAEATLAVTQAQAGALVAQTNIDASMQAAAAHFGDAAQAADGAAQSTVSYANALATLADPMASAGDKMKAFAADIQGASDAPRTLLDAMNAADKSVTSFAESTIKITPAMIDATGAINTATKAGQELATGISGTAKAYDNLKGATIASSQAAGDDMVTSLAKGDAALETMRQKLIDTAVQHGATRDAAQKMVDTYLAIPPSVKTEIQQPGMVAALADALGLKDKITSVPDNKTIVVSSITAPVQKQLEDLGLTVTKLPNGQIIISANTDPALLKIAQAQAEAQKKEGIIPIDGDPAKFQAKLRDGVGVALATTATMKLDANSAPAGLKRDLWKQDTNATIAVAKVDANTQPAAMKRDLWKNETNGLTATSKMDANTGPADSKRTTWKAVTDATTATMTANANTAAANAALDYAARTRTAYINVITTGATSAGNLRINNPTSGGGVFGYSGGGLAGSPIHAAEGYVVPGYAPGVDDVPAVLSKGEAVLVPELVRALGAGRILAANAEASGGRPASVTGNLAGMMDGMSGLVPKGLVEALRSSGRPSGSDGAAAPSAPRLTPAAAAGAEVATAVQTGIEAGMARVLDKLRAGGDTHIEFNIAEPSQQETADEVVRRMRRISALGMFSGGFERR
ncbi:MAG: hypothetical protein J0I49_35080 [Pseudonocardia sp.]|uniref:hypothetical protein n=1 Tax=Pseudonocardia sp. TaxID=60912 RepID=UPI001ACFA3C0|nr:hypothetical protein [Pseudonocardia sp.]MBN9103281.1 hypothetical protein [Pseudonocardia sp.]